MTKSALTLQDTQHRHTKGSSLRACHKQPHLCQSLSNTNYFQYFKLLKVPRRYWKTKQNKKRANHCQVESFTKGGIERLRSWSKGWLCVHPTRFIAGMHGRDLWFLFVRHKDVSQHCAMGGRATFTGCAKDSALKQQFSQKSSKYECKGRQEIREVFKAMVGCDSTALRFVCFQFSLFSF